MTRWTPEQWKEYLEAKGHKAQAREQEGKRSKFGNKREQVDGIWFDSKGEAARYIEIKMMEKAGLITDLQLQVSFELAPKVKIAGKWKPPLRYVADFVYTDVQSGKRIVEDFKGVQTKVFRIKRHLMKFIHDIDITITKKRRK